MIIKVIYPNQTNNNNNKRNYKPGLFIIYIYGLIWSSITSTEDWTLLVFAHYPLYLQLKYDYTPRVSDGMSGGLTWLTVGVLASITIESRLSIFFHYFSFLGLFFFRKILCWVCSYGWGDGLSYAVVLVFLSLTAAPHTLPHHQWFRWRRHAVVFSCIFCYWF